MTIQRLAVFMVALLSFAAVCTASGFDGEWRGTYDAQPSALLPGGSYPETVNSFELRLKDTNGTITGEFRSRQGDTEKVQAIANGKRFGDRACFDIVLGSDDMRWCVRVKGVQLSGVWSEGPEGGPLLGGAGAGVRLFKISGRRAN